MEKKQANLTISYLCLDSPFPPSFTDIQGMSFATVYPRGLWLIKKNQQTEKAYLGAISSNILVASNPPETQ